MDYMVLKSRKITKRISNKDEFYSSDEFNKIWDGFQGKERAIRIGNLPDFDFICGFVTEEDPKTNYGRSFNLYKMYDLRNGLTCLKEVTVSSSLSNQGLQRVVFDNNEIQFTTTFYQNNKRNQELLAKTAVVIH